MSATSISFAEDAPRSEPVDVVRVATVAMAVTCVVWRAAVAVALPLSAWPYLLVDLALVAVQGVWTWHYVQRPTRAAYVVGCSIVSIPLGVSIGLSVAAGAGAFGAPLALGLAEGVAFGLNLVLLGLTLVGALGVVPGRLIRGFALSAIGLAALGITGLVGGITHHHGTPAVHWVVGAHGQRVAQGSVFFCHLI